MSNVSNPTLGQRIRALRTRNHWRISDVSRLTGLATSTISKVENDQMSLTYDKLQQLTKGLSLDLAELFAETTKADASATARRSFGRAGDGVAIAAGSYQYRYLNADLALKRMVPIEGVITARTLEEFGPLISHEGEEFVLVLEGVIIAHTEFYAPLTLNVGDHLYIDSRMGHAYLAGSEGRCRIFSVCAGAPTEDLQNAVHRRALGSIKPAQTPTSNSLPPVSRTGRRVAKKRK